jgi:ABC-type transport system involved in multi-copper enzyme maturation permease subunit
MRSVLEIARLQLLENIRRQVHLVTLFMAFGMLILPSYVNAFSMGLQAFELVAKDFGLTLLSYYGVAMSLLLGSSVVPRDIERKTIYPILSRPLPRVSYLAGQFLGTATLLTASLLLLAGALGLGIFSLSRHYDFDLFWAALGYSLECWVLISACLCFSTIASPPLAGVMGFFLYVIGGMSGAFINFFLRDDRGATHLARGVEVLKGFFPSFDVFRLKYPVVHDLPIAWQYHGAEILYALGWVMLFLLLAGLRFEKRDL